MGGLGPGIGGSELIVIGLVALLVVGPKDLPLLMRRVGQAMAKARAMANEFRASFDEMARQSELDDLRKEVEALRRGQGMLPLGAEAESTFREINADLNQPLLPAQTPAPVAAPEPAAEEPLPQPVVTGVSEWPDTPPPVAPKPARKPRAAARPKAAAAKAKPATKKAAAAKPAAVKAAPKRKAAPKAAADKPAPKPRTRKSAT